VKPVQITTTYATIVGAVFAHLRDVRGLSQARVAECLGVATSSWSRVESGGTAVSITQLAKVASVFQLEPWQILVRADRVRGLVERQGIHVAFDVRASELKLSEGQVALEARQLLDLVRQTEVSG
jgi:transcriptional regulator with XRE-family HTH domain